MTAKIHNLQEYKKNKMEQELLREAQEIDQEHKEFIKLLRRFVEIQEPKHKLVTVSKTQDGEYNIVNENNEELTSDFPSDTVLTEDDILVNVLIVNCPSRIFLKTLGMSEELVQTITLVFEGRVSILEEEDHGVEQ